MLVIKRPIMGIIVGALLASIWPVSVMLILPFLLCFACFVRRDFLIWVLALTLGMGWVSYHWSVIESAALPDVQLKENIVTKGLIKGLKVSNIKTEFDLISADLNGFLKVSCYLCPLGLANGQKWVLALKVKPIHSFQNPGGFDYRKWMLAQGYIAQAYVDVKDARNVMLEAPNYKGFEAIGEALDRKIYPLLSALLLGDKSGLESEQKRFVFTSGIGHLFVVSGLHVGIIASFVAMLFFWLQRPLLFVHWSYVKEASVLLGVLAAIFYGVVTGMQVPALRAVMMLVMAGILLLQSHNRLPLDYLLIALILVLVVKPLAFVDMGSWLSFAIVLGFILGFAQSKRTHWFKGLVKAQWIAFCVGGVVLVGHGLPLVPVSMLLNFVLVPLFAVCVMPLAVVAVVWACVVDQQGLLWLEMALQWMLQTLMLSAEVFSWEMPVHDSNRWLCMLALVLLVLPKAFGFRFLGVGVMIISLLMPFPRPEVGGFQLTVLDVGQGSSAMVRTANHSILVDTGARFLSGMTLADYVVLPYMRRVGVRQFDLLHLTHDDNDHAGGLALLTSRSKERVDQHSCDPDRWIWDDVEFERFQAPGFTSGNNGSCLLKVTSSSGKSVLFTGDIEKPAEMRLVESFGEALKVDVLISPHHGSRSSSSDAFLDYVDADWVFISAGFLNHYGHPHEQILAKYRQRDMRMYTTSENGAIQVEFPPRQEALVVSPYRP